MRRPGEGLLVALVSGEPSGDTLGEHLQIALARRHQSIRFIGIGGPKMISAGLASWFPQERLAVRGLVEVIRHLPELMSIRRKLIARLMEARPDVLVGVDSPDFNLGVERRLRAAGIPTVHYVSPTIWAWRPGRIRTIRRAASHVLVLFPFEADLYARAGVPATFVGHPLADEIGGPMQRGEVRERLRLPPEAPVVAILPGSRRNEIELMAPPFVDAAVRMVEEYPTLSFIAPFVTRETRELFEETLHARGGRHLRCNLMYGHAHEALAAADVAMIASGTATLEAALVGCPMVIAYRLTPLSYWLARKLVRTPYIGLPNILAGEAVCPEFIQEDAHPANLSQAVLNLLGDRRLREGITARLTQLGATLRRGAAERAADAIDAVLGTDAIRA